MSAEQDGKPKIVEVKMFQTEPMDPVWLGTFPKSGTPLPESGFEGTHSFDSGWTVRGVFWDDNMSSGFEVLWGTNKQFPDAFVTGGEYNTGLVSNSKEALEHFIEHHPPYESD